MQAFFDSTLFSANMSPWVANLSILFAKGLLVLSATWLMAYALKGSAAAIRFMVWCTGLLSLMMLPLLSTMLPAWQLGILPSRLSNNEAQVIQTVPPGQFESEGVAVAPLPEFEGESTYTSAAASPAIGETAASTGFFSLFNFHWTTWAFVIWMVGVVVAGVRLILAHAGAAKLIRKSELVHDEDWHLLSERITRRLEIDGFVRLRKSEWTSVPMSVGIWKPTIVLPEGADVWDEAQRRTVLYHELAHVKRKDCLLQLLIQITCALYWFNPLVWVAAYHMRIERERACDDLVLTSGVDASSYAETLLQTARQIKKSQWSTLATVAMARQSQLEGRLLSILDPMRWRSLNKASAIVTMFMIACIVLPLAIMQPAQAQQAVP